MAALLLYLLKANAMLAVFAAAYYGLLRRLTFFGLNRAYLVFALVFAAIYPAVPMPALLPAAAMSPLPLLAVAAPTILRGGGTMPVGVAWPLVGLGLYAFGVAVLLLRLGGQLLSLAGVRRRSEPVTILGQPVRRLAGTSGPFSFGQTIYLSEATLADARSVQAALRHEQAHVRQWHTLDVLLLQVAVALAWANPAAWLLRRAGLDNLEYLADRAALQSGLDRRAYQYSLLQQQPSGVAAPALAFHFSFLTLKNRIVMLNQPASPTRQLGRYLLAAPLLMLLALGYSGARAQTAPATATATAVAPNLPTDVAYYLDGEPSTLAAVKALPAKELMRMDVLKDIQAEPAAVRQALGNPRAADAVIITTKANANSPAVKAMQDKVDSETGYVTTPVEVNAVVPKALAYITSHYPSARLSGQVLEVKKKSTGAVKYQVQLAEGRRPFYVFFTPQGDFLAEQR